MSTNGDAAVPLGKLLTPIKREVTVEAHCDYELLGARWYAKGLYTKEIKPGSRIKASKLYRVQQGDFVYNRLFAWKGSFAVASPDNHGCYVSNEFPCFDVNTQCLHPSYLWYYFQREAAWNEALGMSFGATPTSRNRLKEEQLLSIHIPLPPLPEQRRIVAKLERLAAKIDEAYNLKSHAELSIDGLYGSYTFDLFTRQLHGSVPAIPLGEIADIVSGVTLGRQMTGPMLELPYLRVANVQDGFLDLGIIKQIYIRADESEKWQLRSGDLLLTEGGDWDKLGRGTVWHNEIPHCIHQNHIFRVRLKLHEYEPRYVLALTRSPYGKEYFQEASKQTTNLASINQRQLKAFPVYRVPLPEQHRIVAYLDGLQAKADELKRRAAESAAELDALLPAILDRAFKGQLTDVGEKTVVPSAATRHKKRGGLPDFYNETAIAAYVVAALSASKSFGRTKLEKSLHFIEAHYGVELNRNPVRDAAGPVDFPALKKVEWFATKKKWFEAVKHKTAKGARVSYKPGARIDQGLTSANQLMGARKPEIDAFLEWLRPLSTFQCEIIATLYAGWNDLLASGNTPTDSEIVEDVRTNWHDKKAAIQPQRWRNGLAMLRRFHLIPSGQARTVLPKRRS